MRVRSSADGDHDPRPGVPASVQAWSHSASGSTRWSTDSTPRAARSSTEVSASARCSGVIALLV